MRAGELSHNLECFFSIECMHVCIWIYVPLYPTACMYVKLYIKAVYMYVHMYVCKSSKKETFDEKRSKNVQEDCMRKA